MRCPYCHYEDTQVTDSRLSENGEAVKRRRKCLHCERRFTTYERIERIGLTVVKKDNKREAYRREKLAKSLEIACTKRPVSAVKLEEAVNDIEAQLFSLGTSEVPTDTVGELVMQKLRELDEVAYIRFASVYRNFADLEEMREAMEGVTSIPHDEEPAQEAKPKRRSAKT
jgi:transcriptional repressor NrdR